MSSDRSRIVFDIVVFSIISMAAANDCELMKVLKCTEDMQRAVAGNTIFHSDQQRENVCQALKMFKTCLERTHCQNISALKPLYEVSSNILEFVCNDSSHSSESVVACWKINGFVDARNFCTNGTRYNDMSCNAKNDMVSCTVKSVKHCCSEEAADYINKSFVLMLEPLLVAQGCTMDTDRDVVALQTCEAPITDTNTSTYAFPTIDRGVTTRDPSVLGTKPLSSPTGVKSGLLAGIIISVFITVCAVAVVVVVIINIKRRGEPRHQRFV